MRGVILFIVFFALLPLVFKRPYVGILLWFWISLMISAPCRLWICCAHSLCNVGGGRYDTLVAVAAS